ncbi:hypothetical protein SAMN02745673_01712 [Marinactinospora thermotolerans DSM 45154]|uniref:Uncharacterized protein n=1 Tax=Marinactinospora thermotolerans DSM 45154 TaxID=1122192 RepID=A0A1T4PB94_9ACTN|nr:hypothetical protein [Marinactinospora thermotolerans]SJZ88651.1 hypothetical protein SAMN02745673_01712 [Marinactinospora thermotolerans DSM 45154]
MTSGALAGLRQLHDDLALFDHPDSIRRVDELGRIAATLPRCAAELEAEGAPDDVRERLAMAFHAVRRAERAALGYRDRPLTRPLSQAKFALASGQARGWVLNTIGRVEGDATGEER